MNRLVLRSEVDTQRMAAMLAPFFLGSHPGGLSIGLEGELGAGKTAFVRALVGVLGGDSKEVASPSFALSYEYALQEPRILEHWDLYRLHAAPSELLEPPPASMIRIVEWPDRCREIDSSLDLIMRIVAEQDGTRIVTWRGPLAELVDGLTYQNEGLL